MKYLVDANVLSEPMRPAPDPRVIDWLRAHEADIALEPIVLGEIEYGILLREPGRQRRLLEGWFAGAVKSIQVLEFNHATAGEWAALLARLKRKGTPMPVKDSLIAATALLHNLTMVTRNTADFAKAQVPAVNPFLDA